MTIREFLRQNPSPAQIEEYIEQEARRRIAEQEKQAAPSLSRKEPAMPNFPQTFISIAKSIPKNDLERWSHDPNPAIAEMFRRAKQVAEGAK